MTLKFKVPWEALCSKNAKYVGKFDKVLSPRYREAQDACGKLAMLAAKKAKWQRSEKRCRVEVIITEPDRLVRDAYNFGECILDALSKSTNDAIWWNDCQATDVRFVMSTTPDKVNPGATITIEEL